MHVQYPHVGHKYSCCFWQQKKMFEHDVNIVILDQNQTTFIRTYMQILPYKEVYYEWNTCILEINKVFLK
jgi:nitrate reductase beta subunit